MKFIDEYRDPDAVRRYAGEIARITTGPWTIMEICGGQTHSIVKNGLDRILPDEITLLHGPGCPVCVTSAAMIDKAVALASRDDIIFCSFGDMLRVPGSRRDLLSVKADGGDVRTVYAPLDAVRIAERHPERRVVFFAIGFETTAPANAAAVWYARKKQIDNFSMLVAQVLVPPAIETILGAPDCRVQGFLAAGHVCTVMGYTEYEPIAEKYRVPIVVTGFEPLDILQGIHMTVRQLEHGQARTENQYSRAVTRPGNLKAQELMADVFETVDREWRGIGVIPKSGLALRPAYRDFDAETVFDITTPEPEIAGECISGLILQGKQKPSDCPAFGKRCTPEHPLGATMVSSEGACAAYYAYRPRRSSHLGFTPGKN